MIFRNYDIYCYTGESFTLDFTITNEDDTPFTIPSYHENPKLLFTMSSLRYDQKDRYLVRLWVPLDHVPRINSPTPIQKNGITVVTETDITYAKQNGLLIYINGASGKEYYYLHLELDDEGDVIVAEWRPYDFMRIIIPFTTNPIGSNGFGTKEWIEQRYAYSIKYVTGEKNMQDTLKFNVDAMLIPPSNIYVTSDVE